MSWLEELLSTDIPKQEHSHFDEILKAINEENWGILQNLIGNMQIQGGYLPEVITDLYMRISRLEKNRKEP